MARALKRLGICRANVMSVAFALFLCAQSWAMAQEGEAVPPAGEKGEVVTPTGTGVGMVRLGASGEGAVDRLRVVGRAVFAWLGETADAPDGGIWGEAARALTADGGGAWTLVVGDDDREDGGDAGAFSLRSVETDALGVFPFDLSLDCNRFRGVSPGPFSRTVRGRVFDSLQIDNAREARLTLVPSGERGDGAEDDREDAQPEEETTHSLVFFTQSRGEVPGTWHAVSLAGVGWAPSRGERVPSGHPVELDFGDRRESLAVVIADLVLASEASDTISTRERLEAWGVTKASAVQRLARASDGRVWLWTHGAEAAADAAATPVVVTAFPLGRGATDREVARSLGVLFAQRLVWNRSADGRVTATLAFKRENGAPADGNRAVSMRFVTIGERTTLVVATDAAALDEAPGVLATIPPGQQR